jgi:starch synthase (maltosyl-transferring)
MIPQDYPRVIIEAVEPQVDCGRYPIKRVVGEKVVVLADIYKEGHDKLAAAIKYRRQGETDWQTAPMAFWDNDRWRGEFSVGGLGRWEYTIEGYAERYLSWVDELTKKNLPGAVLTSELLEGLAIMRVSAGLASGEDQARVENIIEAIEAAMEIGQQDDAVALGTGHAMRALMTAYPDRSESAEYTPYLEIVTTRPAARFAAWYEFFPRSQSDVPGQHGTLQDCIRLLPRIKALGFDVIYLPPIHPIGHAFRKGKNNSLIAGPDDVGSPWAIGNEHGGHTGLEPQLGTWADWDDFAAACRQQEIEIALDYVMNCSPNHPYVTEHPDWFYHRPDGSIKYAENPPKKYQDVYPLNFGTEDRAGLWQEMLHIFLFWIDKGVTTFRVDNPHTKPVAFWEWVIGEVHRQHPGTVFLAEAFTKPKMMRLLAKAGFTQSYTYFTWRNTKPELTEYITELTTGPMKEYYTGNFFANTPDILPEILQIGGRPAFVMRAVLAATLSSVYGIYSGFELCENQPIPGKEEYLDSEKYELKQRDWEMDSPNNIAPIIARLNQIRRERPALQRYNEVRFFEVDNPHIIGYYKMSEDGSDIVACVVNLDPFHVQESLVHLPLAEFGLKADELFQAHDLLHDERYLWRGASNYVKLEPTGKMAHVFKIRRWQHYEAGFDYFV